eukprot:3323600-Rhodomonas_salina.1
MHQYSPVVRARAKAAPCSRISPQIPVPGSGTSIPLRQERSDRGSTGRNLQPWYKLYGERGGMYLISLGKSAHPFHSDSKTRGRIHTSCAGTLLPPYASSVPDTAYGVRRQTGDKWATPVPNIVCGCQQAVIKSKKPHS